jgi:hypothetical protein
MFEIVFDLVRLAIFVSLIAIAILAEYLDWHGRVEMLEAKHPTIYKFAVSRPLRLILILLALGLLAEDSKELVRRMEGEQNPPTLKFVAPAAPDVCKTNAFIEPEDSLRRRTIRLADEILEWEQDRYEHHPAYAYPNLHDDPYPTPDRQKLIDTCLQYDRETYDQFGQKFKEQWIEIVHKYELENVKVGTLANDAEQNHPAQDASMGAQFYPSQEDGSYYSALSRFRELAYHVDNQGHRIDLP